MAEAAEAATAVAIAAEMAAAMATAKSVILYHSLPENQT
jgi:hypothetical protein